MMSIYGVPRSAELSFAPGKPKLFQCRLFNKVWRWECMNDFQKLVFQIRRSIEIDGEAKILQPFRIRSGKTKELNKLEPSTTSTFNFAKKRASKFSWYLLSVGRSAQQLHNFPKNEQCKTCSKDIQILHSKLRIWKKLKIIHTTERENERVTEDGLMMPWLKCDVFLGCSCTDGERQIHQSWMFKNSRNSRYFHPYSLFKASIAPSEQISGVKTCLWSNGVMIYESKKLSYDLKGNKLCDIIKENKIRIVIACAIACGGSTGKVLARMF